MSRPADRQADLLARMQRFVAGLPPRMQRACRVMLDRKGYLEGHRVPDYFSFESTPVVPLPFWTAERLAADGVEVEEAVLGDFSEAFLTSYLLVRVQDDFADEDLGDPFDVVFLCTALQARVTAILTRHIPAGSPYWTLHEELWTGYAEAMHEERELTRTTGVETREDLDRILQRSRPLVLPAAAVLAVTDRWDLLPGVETFVQHLVAAVQLFDDVMDALDDQAAGALTFAVVRNGGRDGDTTLQQHLLAGGGLDRAVNEASDELKLARAAAESIRLTGGRAYVDAKQAFFTEQVQKQWPTTPVLKTFSRKSWATRSWTRPSGTTCWITASRPPRCSRTQAGRLRPSPGPPTPMSSPPSRTSAPTSATAAARTSCWARSRRRGSASREPV